MAFPFPLWPARDDERALAASGFAADYARYKRRVGMFVPRLAVRGAAD